MRKQTNCKSIRLATVFLPVSNEGLKLNFCTNWIAEGSDFPMETKVDRVKVYCFIQILCKF